MPQSGSELAFWAVLTPNHEPWNYTKEVATKLNCSTDDTTAMMDCMRQKPWKEVQQNQGFQCAVSFYLFIFFLTILLNFMQNTITTHTRQLNG